MLTRFKNVFAAYLWNMPAEWSIIPIRVVSPLLDHTFITKVINCDFRAEIQGTSSDSTVSLISNDRILVSSRRQGGKSLRRCSALYVYVYYGGIQWAWLLKPTELGLLLSHWLQLGCCRRGPPQLAAKRGNMQHEADSKHANFTSFKLLMTRVACEMQ